MRMLGSSGVWELFVPGLAEGELYKYEIFDREGFLRLKTDPYGSRFEGPPGNASIVCNPRKFAWNDGAWLERRRAARRPPRPGDLDLRGPSRLLEAQAGGGQSVADLPGIGPAPGRLRRRAGVHPRGGHAPGRASVRRFLGLPGDGVLRPDPAVWAARGFRLVRRPSASARHRRHPRLGPGAFPPRQLRPGRIRRQPSLRARRSPPGRAHGLGHVDLQLRPQRGPLLPDRERPGLDRPLPPRRTSRRRRRLDALPGLFPPSGRVDPEPPTAAGKISRRSISSAGSTTWSITTLPASS